MIDEKKTFNEKKYCSFDLSSGSNKKVWAICDICHEGRWVIFQCYRDRCVKCKHTDKSKELLRQARTGTKQTEETKLKMRLHSARSKMGKKNPVLKCHMCNNWFLAKSRSTLFQNNNHFCSDECEGKYHTLHFSGENNPNWQGGISTDRNIPGYARWRTSVVERDNFMCQLCGTTDDIEAHHIESWADNPDLRLILNNGVTLCTECHSDFHSVYGRGNNSELQLKEYTRLKHGNT